MAAERHRVAQRLFPGDGSFSVTGLMLCPALSNAAGYKGNNENLKKCFVAVVAFFLCY